jgi:spoIIIJ-associated protein
VSDVTETEAIDDLHSDVRAASEAPTASQLEEEGDIAADYIEELLDISDLDGDIDIDARGGRAYLSVNSSEGSSNLSLLAKPETVNALQDLTRIAVQTSSFWWIRPLSVLKPVRPPPLSLRCRPTSENWFTTS